METNQGRLYYLNEARATERQRERKRDRDSGRTNETSIATHKKYLNMEKGKIGGSGWLRSQGYGDVGPMPEER